MELPFLDHYFLYYIHLILLLIHINIKILLIDIQQMTMTMMIHNMICHIINMTHALLGPVTFRIINECSEFVAPIEFQCL